MNSKVIYLIKDLAITLIVAISFMLIGAYLQWTDDVFFEDVEIVRIK